MNYTLNFTIPEMTTVGAQKVMYVEQTRHAIGIGEIAAAIGGYAILVYYWILVNKNKEYYTHWKNPSGREVNLFKIIRNMMYIYPITIVILALIQIYLNTKLALI